MNVLTMQDVRKSFGSLEVLKGISLTVGEGEAVSVIGPSGSGKSTLLRCATLLETMDGGSLAYGNDFAATMDAEGKSVYADKAALRRIKSRFGLVFQQFNLFPHYTVLKNVTDAPLTVQKRERGEVRELALSLLEKMGLADKADAYPCQLSGGQQQRVAIARALEKATRRPEELDLIFAGDLLNQCIGTSFALREFGVPLCGVYGACSTMGESLALAAMSIDGGFARRAAAMTSSHFCTAERQYRMPVPYGSQRTPTAQWTATAAGCCILSNEGRGPAVTHAAIGRIVDRGITDANNMGAAMAPAAYDTLRALFSDTRTSPADYDLIVTGDLGRLGHEVVTDLFARDGVDMTKNYKDCGLLLYDLERQDMHMGGSGCGCSAAVLNGYLLREMREGKWNRIVFAPTGALLSPTSTMQGESIPGVCHAVILENIGEES